MTCFRISRALPLALAAGLTLAPSVARAEGGSRWVAAIPFGAGQLHNGDVGLGVFFAVGQAVFGAASLATVAAVNHLATKQPRSPSDAEDLNDSIRAVTALNRISFTCWATLAAAGVVEAQMSFARKHSKERPLPISTALVPLPGGALASVGGVF